MPVSLTASQLEPGSAGTDIPISADRSNKPGIGRPLLHYNHSITIDDVNGSTLYNFQIWTRPQSLLQSCPCCYSQGISHLQPVYLRHHPRQIPVGEP